MPDFDKDLNPFLLNKDKSLPTLPNPSTDTPNNYAPLSGGAYGDLAGRGLDPIFGKSVKGSGLLPTVSAQELYQNRRYDVYSSDIIDIENQKANAQSRAMQAVNGVLKGTNLAATTVAGGFGMLYGAVKSPFTGRLADIWDNEVMQGLDKWNNEVDQNYLPNYYSNLEKEAKWYSTDNWMTTNFLFDKLIKNSGFAVGAMVSGNIANGVIGAAGAAAGRGAMALAGASEASQAFKIFTPLLRNTARAFSQAKNIEAAGILEKELSSIADITTRSSKIAQLAKTTNTFAGINDYARRTAIATYSSAGEASFEALQTSNEHRNKLIENYKENFGTEPEGEALANINKEAEQVGKTSFLGNLALLTLTEFKQLPYLTGSSYSASKQAANSLVGRADDVVLKGGKYVSATVEPATRFGKLYKTVKRAGVYVFDPKEAAQEVGQYALQVGTQNYFNKAKETNDADILTDGFLYGMFGTDEEGKDVGALVSKEGIEGGILGGITGGLMQAKGTYQERKALKTNTEKFIASLNNTPSFREAFEERLASANRGIVLQQQQQDAVIQGDKLEAKDLDFDMMHNYLSTRIKYGRFDMIAEDISELKQMGMSDEGLASLKEQGLANINDTVQSFQTRIETLMQNAKDTEQLYKATDLRYSGEILKDADGQPILNSNGKQLRKYSPLVIDKMVYAASKIANYDIRIPQVNMPLLQASIVTSNVLESIIKNNKPNREATDEVLKQINDLDIKAADKDDLKKSLSEVIELSLRRKAFMQEYDDIQKNPLNYETSKEFAPGASEDLPVGVTQQELQKDRRRKPIITEKKLEIGKEYSLAMPLLKKGSELFIAPKITVLSQTLGGEYEVRLPNGEVKFLTPTEFKEYSISDEDNTSEEMAAILDKAIDTVLNKEEYLKYNLELNIAGPENIYDKRAFVNDLDDQALIDDIEKEFNAGTKDLLEKRKQEKILKEKLLKAKQTIDAQQKKLENNSGDVESVSGEIIGSEDKRKDVDILFLAGTSPSEDTGGELVNNLPHIKRSRRFLNNFKFFPNRDKIRLILVTPNNAKELGLEGIVQLSYDMPLTESLTDKETNTEMGFMAQVFIIQTPEGDFFINEKGEKLSKVGETNPEILNNIVFQTMTSASPTTISGSEKVRAGQEAEAEIALEAYKLFRKDVFVQKGYTPYSFAISRGIPKKNKVNNVQENNNVEVILGNSAEKLIANENGLIKVVTTGKISHQGQLISYTKGAILIQYGDLLDYVNNKRLTNKQANNIFAVIDAMSKDIVEKSAKNLPIKLNWNYSTFLQNVLYWRSKGDTSTPSQISIDTTTMEFKIGKEAFPINKIAENKQQIMNALQDAFITVNNKTLDKGVDEKFTEYVVNKEGVLVPVVWKNYQTYLLSNKNPDGSTRSVEETPLITHTSKPSETANSYKQKYAYITDKNVLPYDKVPAKKTEAPKPPTPSTQESNMIGEYKMDGTTVNTFTVNTGPILFTGKVSPEGLITVDVKDNETIEKLSTVQGLVDAVDKNLRSLPEEIVPINLDKSTNEEKAKLFVKITIEGTLGKQLEAQQTAPKGEQKKTPPAQKDRKTEIKEKLKSIQGRSLGFSSTTTPGTVKFTENGTKVTFVKSQRDKYGRGNEVFEITYPDGATSSVIVDYKQRPSNGFGDKKEFPFEAEYSENPKPLLDELATLENKEEKPSEEKPYDPSKRKRRNDSPDYRRVGKNDRERMSNADFEAFKQWHAEKVPNIPFEDLNRMVITLDGEEAWGVFENGVAKFVRGGLRGTEYHEIGHGIWTMLSAAEQEALLNEFRSKSGSFTDRVTGKAIEYAEATDLQAEERIWDDFADYRLGKLPARSLGERVRRLFKMIMDFFKTFGTKPSLKKELFEAIDSGKFKETKLSESAKAMAPKYRAVEGLTEEETNEYIQDMVAQVKLIIFQEGRKDLLFNPEKLTGEQVFSQLREEYEELGEIDALGEKRYNELVKRSVDFIRTLGISFNPEEVVSINDENSNSKDYTPEVFSVDWKKHSTGALKFLLSTLTERKGLNQTNVEKGTELKNAPINRSKVLDGYKILNFNRVFATLLDRLHNTNDPIEFTNKFIQLAKEDSNYLPLFKALGGNPITHEFDFSNFGVDTDWRLFIQFFNTFSRQKPDALIQYVSEEGDVHTGSANLFTTVNQNVDFWVANMKTIGKSEEGIISYDKKEKVYKIDRNAIKDLKIKKPIDMLNFLAKIGVDFPIGTYEALSNKEAIVKGKPTSEVEMFNNAVASIYTQLGSNNDLMTFDTKRLEIRGPLRTLATLYTRVNNPNQDSTYFGVEGQRIGSFSENNAPSYFENTFNESETLQELLDKMPQLKDIYSAGSQVLKEGGLFFNKEGKRIAEVKVQYIQGSKNALTGKDQATAKLAEGERFVQEINQNINGNYYVLIPGDSSTEWMMNLGNTISMRDVISGNHWDKVFNIYSDYLNDDINLALENRKQNLFTRSKSQELRIMRDILPKDIVEDIEDMIKDEEVSYEDIQDYIVDNKDDINKSIKSFIEDRSKETINILLNSNQVSMVGESSYYLNKFDTQFLKDYKLTGEVTYDELLNVINFANINYTINNQEYHKILFGDPYQFKTAKGKLDETKRIKSFLSGRRRTFDHPEYNNKLKEIYNTVDGIELDDKTPGHHNYKAYTNTITFVDVDVVGSIATASNIPQSLKDAYAETNETDGMSWLMDNTHKEIALKEGQWSNEAEAFHQWHMAYTRRAFDKKGIKKYANEQLRKRDAELLESPMPKHKLAVRKPIISGNKFNKAEIDLVLDKTSQMPLYYHMVEGTSLEKIYEQMFDQNIGYGIVVSGRKVGSEGNYDIYVDGKVNPAKFESIVQVPWKIYGTQVETMSEGEKTQTRGSQLTKMSTMDLYENGESVGTTPERKEVIEQAVKRNTKALQLLNENAYNELLNKLGVVDLGDGYALEDKQRISETLMYEMMRRDLSENAKDTIALNEDGEFIMPFEASPSYTQIKNILYSMVNKALISPAMNGAPHVQVPVTMFEQATEGRSFAKKTETGWVKITKNQYKALTEEEKKSVMLTDDTLKFYEDEDGKRYCEVMLPHWFKGKFGNMTDEQILKYLDTAEGKKILTGIGFRIPTQALSSVEVFRVKGFLPQYMGYTVVVPSEITTKAGSDFDIDKLNMYLKSIYTDRNGNVRLVKYQGTETATKDFFAKVYDDVTKAQAFKKAELIEAIDTLIYGLDDTKKLLNKYGEYILSIQDKYADPFTFRSEIEKELEKLTDDNINAMLRQNYADTMYKKSLENEYYESLEELLTLPENFNKLISPVDDAGLEKISELLDVKRGYSEAGVKGKLINRNFMTKMRHGFITGKRWVGIAAVNITNLSLRQKSKVYLDPAKLSTLTTQEKGYVQDLNIILPHNTLEDGGKQYISLSGIKTADGKQFISDRLSGYATAFVDIANKPFITKIIKSDVVVSTFMFLESIGAGNTGIYFLNQPIIEKYLQYLDSVGSKSVLNSNNISYIKNQFPTTEKAFNEAKISIDQLLDNIQEYGEKGKFDQLKNAEQQLILNEFLKYKILADQLFSYTQSTNYDTTKFGSSDALLKKEWATFNASNFNLISNIDEVLANTFIGKQADLLSKSFASFGAIMKTELPEIKAYTISTLKKYATRKYMSSDDYEKIANLIKNSFVDYVIQNNTTMSNMIKPLLVDAETAVVSQLEQAKQKYPNIQLLQDLSPVPGNREGSAKSIQLKANVKDTYSENLYVGMMRELRDTNAELNDLYNNIVNVAILQGTAQSAISIRNIIPVEDYAAKIAPIIQQLTPSANLDPFANGIFERNNFANKDVFPEFTPYALESDEPNYDPNTGEEYISYSFPSFRSVKGASKVSRKLISLNDRYNSFQLSSDFIKIPKVITTKDGTKVNVATGLEITKADYAKMKAKGDFNLYDAFYYKKVYTKNVDKFNNPIPLMTYNKKIDAYDYYYKLINVYGDGNRAVEINTAFTPSVINNGSITIANELNDQDIVNELAPQIQQEVVSLPVQISEEEEILNSSKDTEALLLKLGAKKVSKGQLNIDGQYWYLNKDNWATMAKKVNNELYLYPGPGQEIYVGEDTAGNYKFTTDVEFYKQYIEKTNIEKTVIKETPERVTINLQPDNRDMIANGEKTTTIRTQKEFEYIGLPVGAAAKITINGLEFNVTNRGLFSIDEVGKEAILKSEGLTSSEDFKFPTSKKWFDGQGKLYIYDFTKSEVTIDEQLTGGISYETVERYTDADVKANPDKLYIFGDNTKRIGTGGQAQIRNNPNAMGIATKLKPSNEPDAFMSDDQFEENKQIIDSDITKIVSKAESTGKTLVFPADGFGTGLAQLPTKAPKTYDYLRRALYNNFGFWNGEEQPPSLYLPKDKIYKTIFDLRNTQIDYTSGQRKALEEIASLIDKEGDGHYLLAGYAGTGKTTIAENIAKYAKQAGKAISVIAPTNKAAKVLNDKLKSTGVGSVASTIHKTIYGEPNDQGEWEKSADIKNSVIIIDESSMIEKSLMADLLDSTKNKGNVLIFMGDSYQLQPVGEDSGLFQGKVPEVKNNQTELTEVKRQSLDSNILKVATVIRNDKQSYVPKESTEDFKVTKSKNEFVENFKQAIKNNEDVAMIVATNNERLLMNKLARTAKFGEAAKNILNPNETIISIANSSDYSNSEVFNVKDVRGEPTKFDITFTDNFGKTSKYDIYLAYVVNNDGLEVPTLFLPTVDKPSIYHAQILKAARESNSDLYNALSGWTMRTKKGEKLSPAISIATYGYAITAHKSQGSQWKKVFVNQNYVADSWDAARWFYTAITRASDEVEVLPSSSNIQIANTDIDAKLNAIVQENAETFDNTKEFTPERKKEILQNFVDKHKMTIEEAKQYIDKAISENREEVINKLKDCY